MQEKISFDLVMNKVSSEPMLKTFEGCMIVISPRITDLFKSGLI